MTRDQIDLLAAVEAGKEFFWRGKTCRYAGGILYAGVEPAPYKIGVFLEDFFAGKMVSAIAYAEWLWAHTRFFSLSDAQREMLRNEGLLDGNHLTKKGMSVLGEWLIAKGKEGEAMEEKS